MAKSHGDSHLTSLTLLARVRSNDPDAWTRLMNLYGPLVRYWCRSIGLQETDVDDVVQEVFRSALAGLANFRRERPEDTFRGWLRAITRSAVALHFRRQGRAPQAGGGSEALLQLNAIVDPNAMLPEEDPPGQLLELHRRGLELVRAEFEERTWQMFWLAVVEDRAPGDVAAQFGVSAVTVRKAKSRVLRRLREELGDLIA